MFDLQRTNIASEVQNLHIANKVQTIQTIKLPTKTSQHSSSIFSSTRQQYTHKQSIDNKTITHLEIVIVLLKAKLLQ